MSAKLDGAAAAHSKDDEADQNPTVKKRILDFALFVLFCLLLILVPFGFLFGPMIWRIERQKHALATASDLHEVASACLELLKASGGDRSFYPSDFDSLPKVLQDKRPAHVGVHGYTGEVTIDFGAGFEHYGYRLEPVPSEPGKWRLVLYGEEPNDIKELLQL